MKADMRPTDSPPANHPPARSSKRMTGMTIVEALIIVAVIGILILLGSSPLLCHLSKTRMASELSDLNKARGAIEAFHAELGRWPNSLDEAYRGHRSPENLIYCTDAGDGNAGHGNEWCTFFDAGNPSDENPQASLLGYGYVLMTERDLCACQNVDFGWVSCCGREPRVIGLDEDIEPPGHPGGGKG